MKIKWGIIFLLLIGINSFAQDKKLPDGWDRIKLEGKTAYKNLVTGRVSKRYPQRPAIIPKEEYVKEFDPTVVHVVKQGETLNIIAKKYDFDLAKLYQLNRATNFKKLKAGKEIIIGYAHSEEEKDAFLNGDKDALNHDLHDHNVTYKIEGTITHKYHIVLFKETLYRIASNYKLSVTKLKRLNNLKKNIIVVGQRLRVK
jgi:LysM repeat protein